MNIDEVLAELHEELARLNEAIATLERLQEGVPRRGRPPSWLSELPRQVRGPSKHSRKRRDPEE
ncbi:MAG: hypothetical protein ACE15B_10380 [Bryobacteraceae bacterium]